MINLKKLYKFILLDSDSMSFKNLIGQFCLILNLIGIVYNLYFFTVKFYCIVVIIILVFLMRF
jgi:hypothetical protein